MTPAPTQPTIVGYDPGFGNTNVCVAGQVHSLQTVVARPNEIGLAAMGLRSAGSQATEVTFANQRYIVGPGSWQRGQPLASMDFLSLTSAPRLALFYAALSPLIPNQHLLKKAMLELSVVIGLPVPLLQDSTQAALVIESLKELKRDHHFQVAGEGYAVTIKRIKVVAQPLGSYMDWLYDDALQIRPGGSKAETAILDIGLNTLDLFVVQGGQVVERHLGGGEVGVQRLLQLLNTAGRDLVEVDADLRHRRLKPTAAQLEAWLTEILATVKRSWPSLKRFSVVIPTGGGAVVLGECLRTALAVKGAAIYWPADPLTANVRGFEKYGRKYAA